MANILLGATASSSHLSLSDYRTFRRNTLSRSIRKTSQASRISPITLNRVCRGTFDFRAAAASNSLRERLLKTPRFFAAKPLSRFLEICTVLRPHGVGLINFNQNVVGISICAALSCRAVRPATSSRRADQHNGIVPSPGSFLDRKARSRGWSGSPKKSRHSLASNELSLPANVPKM